MIDYRDLEDEQAEQVIFAAIKGYVTALAMHGEVGIMCRDVERRQLWKYRLNSSTGQLCTSFGQWMNTAAPELGSRSRLYQAKNDVEALPDVPDDELARMRPCNFGKMKQVSTATRRDPNVLAAARTMESNGFVRAVNEADPSQHLEGDMTFRFTVPAHLGKDARKAIDSAIQENDFTSANDAFAFICAEFNLNRLYRDSLGDSTYESDTIQ